MRVIEMLSEMQRYAAEQKRNGKTVGFVPTMGYLHEGHSSLIKKSSMDNDITVVSVFVNPTQFGENEDFSVYPRDFKNDYEICDREGATVMFYPQASELYPNGYATYVSVERFTDKLCGLSRPTHFRGVTTIVLKLFNIVMPTNAYFGEKDYQQYVTLARMTADLNVDTRIIPCPIVREQDGLAMSSRNVYLTPEERVQATALYKGLCMAKELYERGEQNAFIVKQRMLNQIKAEAPLAEIEYAEFLTSDTLDEIAIIEKNTLIALAVKFPSARLIDNIVIAR